MQMNYTQTKYKLLKINNTGIYNIDYLHSDEVHIIKWYKMHVIYLIYFTFVNYVETRDEQNHCFQTSIPKILLQLT